MELLSAAVQMLTPTPALTPTAHIASLVHFSLSPPAPGPDGLRRGPRVWHRRRTHTSCPTQSLASCLPAWSLQQVRVGLHSRVLGCCCRGSDNSLCHVLLRGLLSVSHTDTHSQTHMPSLPTSSLPAACPRNGSQSKVTHAPNHQTPTAHPFTKNRSSAQSPQTRSGENKLKWRSFLSD